MSTTNLDTLLGHIRRLVGATAADGLSDAQLIERFVLDRDEAAFAALVRRHGPLVLGVCRRLTGHTQDAEDAFQATFLVLARKASAIRRREALGGWLYEVAYHIALKARAQRARRQARERQTVRMAEAEHDSQAAWNDILPVLDEELHRLPDRPRRLLVACYLEGKSHVEAARELGYPTGSMSRHLERARELLRERLTQRGITMTAGMLATVLLEKPASAAISFPLLVPTVRAALTFLEGQTMAASARAVALAQGALRTMFVSNGKWWLGLLLFTTLAAGQVALLARERPAPPRAKAIVSQPRGHTDALGDPLPAEAIARLGTRRFRHSGTTTTARFSRDDKTLITTGNDGLCVWEVPTGRLLHRLPDQEHRYFEASILSPDQKQVVTVELAPRVATLRLWDVATGQFIREVGNHPCIGACFTPDGKTLATFGTEQPGNLTFRHFAETISLWDIKTGLRDRSWEGHQGGTFCGVFTADGKTLITAGADKAIRFWDLATGKEVRHLATSAAAIGHLLLSPDGKRLAAVNLKSKQPAGGLLPSLLPWDADCRVDIFDVASGAELQRLSIPKPKVAGCSGFTAVAFTADSKQVLTGGPDQFARLWDVGTGKEVRRYDFGGHGLWTMALSRDGKTLAALPDGQTVQLIDTASGKFRGPKGDNRGEVRHAIVTTDGKTALTGPVGNSFVRLWEPLTGKEKATLKGPGPFLADMALARDGRTLYSVNYPDGLIVVWNLATRKELRRLPPAELQPAPMGLALSPDGKTLAVASYTGETRLVDALTGKMIHRVRGRGHAPLEGVFHLAFTPDGQRLVLFCDNRAVQIYDTKSGAKLLDLLPPGCIRMRGNLLSAGTLAAALSPDGKLLAYVRPSGSWALWDWQSGKVVYNHEGPPKGVDVFAFSPDGRTLAWSGWREQSIHLLEVASGKERHELKGHEGSITALAFAADSKRLLSGSSDTTALVWDLTGRLGSTQTALTPADLHACWADLASPDAARAYQAIRRLALVPHQAVPYLQQHLKPIPPPDEKRITHLITELDSSHFAVREKATKELDQFGGRALGIYRRVLDGQPSPEVRRRLERLCARYSVNAVPLRTVRLLEALEVAGTDQAYDVFTRLARGASGAWLTEQAKAALQRRYPHQAEQRHDH